VYRVEDADQAQEQVDALPGEALAAFAELRVALETAPWAGEAFRRQPGTDGTMRTLPFGGAGFAVYLILEQQRRVVILEVIWLG
jgi:hypothetical protein